jgi:ABC-type multidrug transport system ATPase subunit
VNIKLEQVGKRFNHEWIFKNLSCSFEAGAHYAITGANGTGKSTLLQIIAGTTLHSTGTLVYNKSGNNVDETDLYKEVALAAPYLDLVEELTAKEFLQFHEKFKPLVANYVEILDVVGLKAATNKQIRLFSSGMKQRLKLAQAFFSDTAMLLLDEPTSNLDEQGIALYHQLIQNYTAKRLVLIASNDAAEYKSCSNIINLSTYKN